MKIHFRISITNSVRSLIDLISNVMSPLEIYFSGNIFNTNPFLESLYLVKSEHRFGIT